MSDFNAPTTVATRPAAPCIAVAPEYARLTRLCGRGCSAAVGAGHPDSTIELIPDPAAHPGWNGALVLSAAFGDIECADGVRLLRTLTGLDLEAAGADQVQREWLSSAIVGRLGTTVLSAIDRIGAPSIAAMSPDTSDANNSTNAPVVLRVTLRGPDHVVTTHARAAASTWIALLHDGAWSPQRAPEQAFDDLPLTVPVRIARHSLARQTLLALGEGDIVVPDSPAFSTDGTGNLRLGCINARVRYAAPACLHILSTEVQLDARDDDYAYDDNDGYDDIDDGFLDEESAADDSETDENRSADKYDDDAFGDEDGDEYDADLDDDSQDVDDDEEDHHDDDQDESEDVAPAAAGSAASATAGAAAVDRVPVTLDFELGKVRLPLGELRALTTGAIVPVEGGSPSLVTIRSGGRKLGQGEIVDVGGQLGIRVTSWTA